MSLPRVSGFYNRLLRTHIFYLYCSTMLMITGLIVGWWFFLYQPATRLAQITEQQINEMQIRITQLRRSEKSLFGISKSIDALKQNVQKYSDVKTHSYYTQQNLALIAEYATNSGVQVDACRSCGQRNEIWCNVTDITGDFKGSFDQMIVFFDFLKNTKQIIDVTKCELLRIDGTTFSLHAKFSLYNV